MGRNDCAERATLERLEQSLRASEARFRNMIERNADGMIVLSRAGAIRFVNPAAEQLLGKPAGDLLGQFFGVPVAPGETAEVDVFRAGRPARVAELRVAEV